MHAIHQSIMSLLEHSGLSRSDGKRPDGITLVPWSHGKCLIWDATCAHRLSPSYTNLASREGATVAAAAEDKKRSKYDGISENLLFQPLAFETLGGIGPSTLTFIKAVGKQISRRSFDKAETIYLRQRLGIAIQAGNAACILENV